MAIQLNPGNYGALAALAGNTMPNYNFPVVKEGIGSLFSGVAQGMQAGAGIEAQKAQTAMQQQRLALDQQLEPQRLSIAQQQVDNQKLQTQMEQQKLQAMLQLSSPELQKMKSFTAVGITALGSAENPEDQEKAKMNVIKYGVDNGILAPEDAKQLNRLTPDQLLMYAQGEYLRLDHAASIKDVQTKKEKTTSNGLNMTFDPTTGNLTSINQTPSPATTNTLQANIASSEQSISQLDKLTNSYKKNYFTYEGRVKATAGGVLSASPEFVKNLASTLGIDVKDAENMATDKSKVTSQIVNMTFSIMKQLSGVQYSDTQLEQMQKSLVQSQDNPAEFMGKLQGMVEMLQATREVNQNLLKQGVPLNSPQADKAMSERLGNIVEKVDKENKKSEGTYIDKKTGTKYTEQDLIDSAKAHNITIDELKQKKGWK